MNIKGGFVGWRKGMEDKKYYYEVTEDGTVVLDQNDEIVVQCPTEQEAVEYIKEHGEKPE